MLSYWILRSQSDAPIGLVRVDNDRVLLQPRTTEDCVYRLFSDASDLPVTPFSEVRFQNAEALVGTKNGLPYAFAAAPGAKPPPAYLARMSQIRTIQEETELPQTDPESAADAPEASQPEQEEPLVLPDVSDTAREAEAFALLLRKANDFYARFEQIHLPNVDNLVQKEDNSKESDRGIDLFPSVFPGARWRYVDGERFVGHYEGVYRYPNGERIKILAVHGKCAPRPPRTLTGFTRFLRACDGTGYWLRLLPLGPDGR